MTGMTLAEKILSRKTGKKVYPGDFIVPSVDLVYAHDGTAPLSIKVIRETSVLSRISSPEKILFFIDHAAPPPSVEAASVQKDMRVFAAMHGIRLFDVGRGICHQVVAEERLVKPGMLVVGADSHTVTLGAFAAFATGVGSTDAAIAMSLGRIWLRVPESIKITISGKLEPWVMGKDIILYIIGSIGSDGATYKAIEFHGPVVRELSIDSRMTMCNMSVEMGAKTGLIPVDERTINWYESQGVSVEVVRPDPDAEYSDELEFDITSLEPQVALPPNVDNVKSISEVEGIEINQVFIGSCTNGRYEDFVAAARILKRHRVRDGVRCIAIPSSREVYLKLMRDGIIEILVKAGCFVSHSTCGPCIGAHLGLLAEDEVVVSTTNRNFTGRMGHKNSRVILVSPLTAAASAVEGKLSDPRTYIS